MINEQNSVYAHSKEVTKFPEYNIYKDEKVPKYNFSYYLCTKSFELTTEILQAFNFCQHMNMIYNNIHSNMCGLGWKLLANQIA